MSPLTADPVGPALASAVTGLDLVALLLLLHVWVVVVGLTAATDSRSGIDWADRRIHLRLWQYAILTLAATVLVWLPFAVGTYPFLENSPFGSGRSPVVLVAVGGVLVGGGCYFFGGFLTALRSLVALRLAERVDAGAVDRGRVVVSGRVVPLGDPLESPLTGREAVWYVLEADREASSDDGGDSNVGTDEWLSRSGFEYSAAPPRVLEDRREPFAIDGEAGRVVVDPAGATCRLERTASKRLTADEQPPEPLAAPLRDLPEFEPSDVSRTVYESTLEAGETATVLGVARPSERDGAELEENVENVASGSREVRPSTVADVPTVTAGGSRSSFVVRAGSERQLARHLRETIAGCLLAAIAMTASGIALLWWLAGHGLP